MDISGAEKVQVSTLGKQQNATGHDYAERKFQRYKTSHEKRQTLQLEIRSKCYWKFKRRIMIPHMVSRHSDPSTWEVQSQPVNAQK